MEKVLISVPGLGVLALAVDTYRQALAEGNALVGGAAGQAPFADEEPLLDAEQLSKALDIPATWLEAAGRDGRIPSIEAGRWRRFRRSAVEAALTKNRPETVTSGRGGDIYSTTRTTNDRNKRTAIAAHRATEL